MHAPTACTILDAARLLLLLCAYGCGVWFTNIFKSHPVKTVLVSTTKSQVRRMKKNEACRIACAFIVKGMPGKSGAAATTSTRACKVKDNYYYHTNNTVNHPEYETNTSKKGPFLFLESLTK